MNNPHRITAHPAPAAIPAPDLSRWSARRPIIMGLITLVILVAGFGGWATLTHISGAVLAPGQVEVESHRQVIQHPEGGVVSEILIREGDMVDSGQILLRLDGHLLRSELAIIEGQYFEILARKGRLEAERADNPTIEFPPPLTEAAADQPALQDLMAGQTSLFETRRETLQQGLEQLTRQVEQITAQVRGIDAQTAALNIQRDLIEQELRDTQALLDKGLAQAPRVLALEREAARLDGQLGELAANRAQAETRATEIDIMRLRHTATRREEAEGELRSLGDKELELAERRRVLTDSVSRLDIRAPVAGIVHQLGVTTPRAVIRAADPILYLVPQDRPLLVAARIAPIDIDQIMVGQPVALRFSAFSQRTTPEIDGNLASISADAVMDDVTRIPYYRAEITIPPDEQARLGGLTLIPGMPVQVFIKTGDQTPMRYLLAPFTDYLSRAMRER